MTPSPTILSLGSFARTAFVAGLGIAAGCVGFHLFVMGTVVPAVVVLLSAGVVVAAAIRLR